MWSVWRVWRVWRVSDDALSAVPGQEGSPAGDVTVTHWYPAALTLPHWIVAGFVCWLWTVHISPYRRSSQAPLGKVSERWIRLTWALRFVGIIREEFLVRVEFEWFVVAGLAVVSRLTVSGAAGGVQLFAVLVFDLDDDDDGEDDDDECYNDASQNSQEGSKLQWYWWLCNYKCNNYNELWRCWMF